MVTYYRLLYEIEVFMNIEDIKADCKVEGDCWIWKGATANGYPVAYHDGRRDYVRRLVWEIVNGKKLDSAQHVRHTCDRKLCVNPEHLKLRFNTVEKRFWAKVDKLGGDNDCWEWTGASPEVGGRFSYNGETVSARRMAWALGQGDADLIYTLTGDDYVIPEFCYNPKCMNPRHLIATGVYDLEIYRSGGGWDEEIYAAERGKDSTLSAPIESPAPERTDKSKKEQLEEYKKRSPTIDDVLALGYDYRTIMTANDNRIPVAGEECQRVIDKLEAM